MPPPKLREIQATRRSGRGRARGSRGRCLRPSWSPRFAPSSTRRSPGSASSPIAPELFNALLLIVLPTLVLTCWAKAQNEGAVLMFQLDPSNAFQVRVADRLKKETVGWLTTVGVDGIPQPSLIWFLWDGGNRIQIYSQDNQKVRN